MQQMIKDFGARSRAIELKYEEEVQWLRRQIEEKGIPLKPRKELAGGGSGGLPLSLGAGLSGSLTLPSFASLSAAGGHALEMPSSMSALAAGRDAVEATKAVDTKGKPLEDWNVVHNPTSTTKMHIELSHTLEHDSVVCCVRFSSDGRYIATGCNKTAVLYDAVTGKRMALFQNESVLDSEVAVDSLSSGDSYVRSVCFSPDSKYLVAGAEDKTIKLWDIAGRRLRYSLSGHSKDIYSVDYSADGQYVVSGSGDKRAKLWDVNTGTCVRTFGDDDGPKDGVTSVAVSPDSKYIAAGSLDRVVRLWELKTGKLVDKFDGHNDSVYSVSFSPDAKLLASGSLDKTLKLWDLTQAGAANRTESKCRHTFQGHKDFVLSVVFAPQGIWLISGSKDRSVQFWDPRRILAGGTIAAEESPALILQGHQNSVISVSHSPAALLFATGSGDKRARIWRYSVDPMSLS